MVSINSIAKVIAALSVSGVIGAAVPESASNKESSVVSRAIGFAYNANADWSFHVPWQCGEYVYGAYDLQQGLKNHLNTVRAPNSLEKKPATGLTGDIRQWVYAIPPEGVKPKILVSFYESSQNPKVTLGYTKKPLYTSGDVYYIGSTPGAVQTGCAKL